MEKNLYILPFGADSNQIIVDFLTESGCDPEPRKIHHKNHEYFAAYRIDAMQLKQFEANSKNINAKVFLVDKNGFVREIQFPRPIKKDFQNLRRLARCSSKPCKNTAFIF